VSLPPLSSLLDRHADAVARYLVALVGSDDAADCLQDTVVNALTRYGQVRHDENLRGWLFSVAHTTALDHFRAGTRRPVVQAGAVPDQPRPLGERDLELWAMVDALPDKQRHAVALRYLADLPYREIARIIDCSESAARQNVRAGLTSLRARHDEFSVAPGLDADRGADPTVANERSTST
jgi:RNA polymerase sigma factor (sigma-70 family)